MIQSEVKVDLDIQERNNQNLTIKEAVEYSGIGESTIRKLLHKKGCSFLLKVGSKHLVKRKEFEEYLDNKHFL